MNTVRLTCGVIHCILGSTNQAPDAYPTYNGVTANGNGDTKYKDGVYAAYQAVVTGTGALTATVEIQASLDGLNWLETPIGTITLTGNDSATDGFTTESPWKFVRAVLSNLTGTDAECYVLAGV